MLTDGVSNPGVRFKSSEWDPDKNLISYFLGQGSGWMLEHLLRLGNGLWPCIMSQLSASSEDLLYWDKIHFLAI